MSNHQLPLNPAPVMAGNGPAEPNPLFIADSFSFGVEPEMKEIRPRQ